MNRIGKIIGFVGGALAILWAMRDRLVSIAAPQDPEPPRFKVVPSPPGPETGDDLTAITGIGPVFAGRLRDAGITTFADVAATSAARLAEITGAPAGRAAAWVTTASTHV